MDVVSYTHGRGIYILVGGDGSYITLQLSRVVYL